MTDPIQRVDPRRVSAYTERHLAVWSVCLWLCARKADDVR